MDLNPSMAKILELKTMKGSAVIAKIAGILSNANRISVNSMTTKATKSGVAAVTPIRFTKKSCPFKVVVMGYIFFNL